MNAKVYRRMYAAVMVILAIAAIGFGVLCWRYDRVPEGCIVLGAVLVLSTVTFAFHVTQANAERELTIAKSGSEILTLECICQVNESNGEACVTYLRKNGVVIDAKDIPFELVKYQDMKLVSVNNDSICLQYEDEDLNERSVTLVCNKPLKVKAATQALTSHGCKLVAT